MNDSSLNQTVKQKETAEGKEMKKRPTPIGLLNCTQTIFFKNKPGNIAISYINGSNAIQNAEKAKRVLMSNLFNQPTAPNQSKNAHMNNQTNIIQTIQASILSSHRPYNPKSSHSIVNSFTSKPVMLNQSKAVSKDQSNQEQYITTNGNNPSIRKNKKTQNERRSSHMAAMIKISLKNNNKKRDENSNSFVQNKKANDMSGVLKSKLNLKKSSNNKTITNSKLLPQPKTQIDKASAQLKDTEKSINQNPHNNLNSFLSNTAFNMTNPQCLTEESSIQISNERKTEINKRRESRPKPSGDINLIFKEKNKHIKKIANDSKVSKLKIQLKKGKKVSINLAPFQNEAIAVKANEEDVQKNEAAVMEKNKDIMKEKEKKEVMKPQCISKKNKAPKCPMKLNLLSLIQENNKYSSNRVCNLSKCSNEDIESIIQTDPNQLDSKRYMEFDSFDDMNAIIRKINFDTVNKTTMNIFKEDNPAYLLFQENFNEKFKRKVFRYENSGQRTNVSGSTCENSSKKTFIPLSKRETQLTRQSHPQ